MVSEPLPSLRWWERAQAQRGLPAGTRWDAKNGGIPWGSPARTLGPKGGWLWRPTSPGNEDVLICINAPFMTQRVLKPWWSWTYQNSAVKRAAARAISGWVTSWEVWYGEPKADSIVSLGVGRYNTSSQILILYGDLAILSPNSIWSLALHLEFEEGCYFIFVYVSHQLYTYVRIYILSCIYRLIL
jgi:hypothetical protein